MVSAALFFIPCGRSLFSIIYTLAQSFVTYCGFVTRSNGYPNRIWVPFWIPLQNVDFTAFFIFKGIQKMVDKRLSALGVSTSLNTPIVCRVFRKQGLLEIISIWEWKGNYCLLLCQVYLRKKAGLFQKMSPWVSESVWLTAKYLFLIRIFLAIEKTVFLKLFLKKLKLCDTSTVLLWKGKHQTILQNVWHSNISQLRQEKRYGHYKL